MTSKLASFTNLWIVCAVILYAADTKTLTQVDKECLDALKVWNWGRMLQISWKDKVTNLCVPEKVKERNMLNTIGQENADTHILSLAH